MISSYKKTIRTKDSLRILRVMFAIAILHLAILYLVVLKLQDNDKIKKIEGKLNFNIVNRLAIKKVENEDKDPLKSANVKNSIESYGARIAKNPEDYTSRLRKGILIARQGKIDEAMEDFERLRKEHPGQPQGYHGIAIIKAKKEQYREALDNINIAINLNPENPRYYIDRGYINYNMKKLETAEKDFKRALSYEPENSHANIGIGEVYFLQDRLEKSAQHIRKALDIDDRIPEGHLLLASVYFDQDKFRESLKHYYIELDNIKIYGCIDDFHKGACYAEMARILAMLDQPQKAKEYIQKFKDEIRMQDMYEGEDTQSRSLIEDIGNAYIELAAHEPVFYKQALFNYKKTLEFTDFYSNIDNFYHYFQCGWSLWEMGKSKEAMKYFNQGLKWKPEHETRYEKWMRGHVYTLHGKYDKAMKYLNRSLELDPTFENVYFTRALNYALRGKTKKALKDLEMVEELRQKGEAIALFHRKALKLRKRIEKGEKIDLKNIRDI